MNEKMEDLNKAEYFMKQAITLAHEGMKSGHGGPFGAIIVKGEEIIGMGYNKVISSNDPTAHAEVIAIRDACKNLQTFDLKGCVIFTSCEPCPMCLSAIYWANIDMIYYANTRKDAANIGFRDDFLYDELVKPIDNQAKPAVQILRDEALKSFANWETKMDKVSY